MPTITCSHACCTWSRTRTFVASNNPPRVPEGPCMATSDPGPAALAELPDDELMEAVQRQTFRFFWEGAHPISGFAPDRCTARGGAAGDLVAVGGSGFG